MIDWNGPEGTGAAAWPRRFASGSRRAFAAGSTRSVLMAVMLAGAVCGCRAAEAVASATSPVAASPSAAALHRPATPHELIANLHAVALGGLLIKPSTFEEPALTNLLGGDRFEWIAKRHDLRMVNIGNFPDTYSSAARDTRYTIYASLQIMASGNQGQLIVGNLDSSIRVATLLDLFGPGYITSDAHAQEHVHPSPLNPRTSPDGNRNFDYEFSRDAVKTNMRFTTDGNGTVESISITQRGTP